MTMPAIAPPDSSSSFTLMADESSRSGVKTDRCCDPTARARAARREGRAAAVGSEAVGSGAAVGSEAAADWAAAAGLGAAVGSGADWAAAGLGAKPNR